MRILVVAAAVLWAGAALADVDGEWRCKANGDIPIGLVRISGADYVYTMTDVAFVPVANDANGSGTLSVEGAAVRPLDGPLADDFGVVGEIWGDGGGIITWSTADGALMECRR
jgi:hypothetical protein